MSRCLRSASGAALVVLVLAACIPARVPPQLENTPGPPVVVTDREIFTPLFSVHYPAGWRLITSAAESEPMIIMASPQNDALIILGAGAVTPPALDGQQMNMRDTRHIILSADVTITVVFVTMGENRADNSAVFESVIASLRAV